MGLIPAYIASHLSIHLVVSHTPTRPLASPVASRLPSEEKARQSVRQAPQVFSTAITVHPFGVDHLRAALVSAGRHNSEPFGENMIAFTPL